MIDWNVELGMTVPIEEYQFNKEENSNPIESFLSEQRYAEYLDKNPPSPEELSKKYEELKKRYVKLAGDATVLSAMYHGMKYYKKDFLDLLSYIDLIFGTSFAKVYGARFKRYHSPDYIALGVYQSMCNLINYDKQKETKS